VKFHPDSGITHSVDGGQDEITVHPQNPITHKSSQRVKIQAPQIEYQGNIKVIGSVIVTKVIGSQAAFLGNLQGVSSGIRFPGELTPPTNW